MIVYAVETRAVGRLYMHRYQYIRAFRLLFNSLLIRLDQAIAFDDAIP